MEATQVNIANSFETHALPVVLENQVVELCSDIMVASSMNERQNNPVNQLSQDSFIHQSGGGSPRIQVPTSPSGVSNCYVFKSRLQEYVQKVGFTTPVYETIKDGLPHEPSFRSTVIVNGVRYDSLPGFFNRKAAEQSAAEIALVELSKCGEKKESISVPVHETGLCKNLLQEYAQKMNYAIPTYISQKDETPGRTPLFWCTVEIGGIQYIGASARTKREAEIKAARIALLSIQSNDSITGKNFSGKSQYTVIPCKRKVPETTPPKVAAVKPKKPRLKKKPRHLKKKPLNQRHHEVVDHSGSSTQGDSSCQHYGNGKSGLVDSLVPSTDVNRDHCVNDVAPIMNNPQESGQLGTLASDSGIGQEGSPPPMADRSDAREENNTGSMADISQ